MLLVLLSCASARERAWAQAGGWSDPYDPDFAPEAPGRREEPAPSKPAEPAPLPETPAEVPEWMKAAGPFLLLDRPDPARFFEPEPGVAAEPKGLEEFLREFKPFEVDQRRWNKMREDFERGAMPSEELIAPEVVPVQPELVALSTAVPRPPPPEIELPTFGTSLSITGRKVIGFNFSEKRFLRDQVATGRPKSTNLIDITQQLQLRMQGKVGPKITVNVDYDDTKDNKQDISVVYQGDHNEVVQNASFGDIDLSLPSTEFVSYNKQLFGIRVNLQYKGFKAIFIGSRTKGQTKTKQFRGNSQFTTLDILDTSYIRRRYYDLTFGLPARLPIQPGSERVFLSRAAGALPNVNDVTLTVEDLANFPNNSSYTAVFTQLSPGLDYTVDYAKGILTFRSALDANAVVAVDFTDAGGTSIIAQTSTTTIGTGGNPSGRLKLIKTFADVPVVSSATEVGFERELKTFYSLGRSQIIRDDGRGNFILRVFDQARNEVGPGLNPVQKYPDTIEVDFENGVFRLLQPFGISVSSPQPDPEIYAPVPLTKRLFHVEYRFRLKTFFLEPSLVLQSETVLLDNVRLQRNVDYFIDYESGFITFFNEDRIRSDSVIDISYEVAPFGGGGTESLLGTRVSYELNRHFSVGSTLLFQTGSKPPTVPTVSDLGKSLLVYEADTQLKDLRLASWLTANFQAEIAQSIANPNLSGRALVENMEGVKQEDSASTLAASWQVAANPTQGPVDSRSQALATETIPVLQINPTAPAGSQETQNVLNLAYDFQVSPSTETSIVYVFSPTGLDFSQKNILEVTMFQAGPTPSNNEISFHLGGISEDADGDGVFDTEDVNLDNILNPDPNEDVGFAHTPPAPKQGALYGAGNGRIDSEDLNRNGRLDPADFTGDCFGYGPGCAPELFDTTSGSTRTVLDFTGWHTFQIPLDISTATLANWLAVKQVRVSIRRRAGGTDTGTVKFARIAVVGNSWQRGQPGDPATGAGPTGAESLLVTAVNNVDNPGYTPIFRAGGDAQQVFNDLYGDTAELQRQQNTSNLQEQALELRYEDMAAGTTVYTKRVFARALDISQHKEFSFLVHGSPPGTANTSKTLFIRAGTDRDFFEAQVPVNFSGWRKITIEQVDQGGDQIPDAWAAKTPGVIAFSSGAPNLQQIGALTAGLYSAGGSADGAVWLNEIHLSEPIKRKGEARKLQADFTVAGWGSFGMRHRFIDRSYQTPTTVVSNQDNRQDSAYLNFDRVRFFPMRFNLSRTILVTPNTNATGNLSNLVTLLQTGKVTTWNGNASGNLSYGAWPRLTMSYDRSRVEYETLTRLDDRQTYNGSLSYGVPIERRVLPRTIDLNYTHVNYGVTFDSPLARSIPGNANTEELTDTYGARLAFVPWGGSTFNPSYTITTVKETRSELLGGREVGRSYPKSLNQNAGFAANFRLLRWLNPSISYNVTTIENSILNVSTFVINGSSVPFDIGEIKTVNRSANGNVSLTLNMGEIFPRSRLLRTLNLTNSYQLQDGDVTNNVERGLDSRLSLWVRTRLKPSNPAAQTANRTLRDNYSSIQRWSPLEAYDLSGRKAAFRTLSLTNNFLHNVQRTETTGTPAKTIAVTLPDVIASMAQLERLLFIERWARNMQMNVKYSRRSTLNVGISDDDESAFGADLRAMVRDRFDTSLSFNLRSSVRKDLRIDETTQATDHQDATVQATFDLGKFRFTPKIDYTHDVSRLGSGVKTQDVTVVTPSVLVRSDIALPRGLYLPFTKRTLLITNRVIWTTTTAFTLRSSPVTSADNSRLFNLNTSADYEVAKNLRMTLNGALQRLWHKFLKEEEFISYQFGTTLTFQF